MLIIDQQFKNFFDVKNMKYALNFNYSASRTIFWFHENQLNFLKRLNVALISNWNRWQKKFIVARQISRLTINNELIIKRKWKIFLKCFFKSNLSIEWIWSERWKKKKLIRTLKSDKWIVISNLLKKIKTQKKMFMIITINQICIAKLKSFHEIFRWQNNMRVQRKFTTNDKNVVNC